MQTKICGDPQTSTALGSALGDDDLQSKIVIHLENVNVYFGGRL